MPGCWGSDGEEGGDAGRRQGGAKGGCRKLAVFGSLVARSSARRRLIVSFVAPDLLTCPACGITEDVLVGGQFITNVGIGQPDTGFRFIEPKADNGPFVYPACGARARAQDP